MGRITTPTKSPYTNICTDTKLNFVVLFYPQIQLYQTKESVTLIALQHAYFKCFKYDADSYLLALFVCMIIPCSRYSSALVMMIMRDMHWISRLGRDKKNYKPLRSLLFEADFTIYYICEYFNEDLGELKWQG